MVLPNGPTLRPRRAPAPLIRDRLQQSLTRLYGSTSSRMGPLGNAPPDGTKTAAPPAPGGPAAEPADRRAFPRRDSACSVQICLAPGEQALASAAAEWRLHAGRVRGPLIDVSLRSVAAALSAPLEAGQRALVRLANRRLAVEIDRRATTVRSTPLWPGEWKVVCRFEEPLTLDELQQFGRFSFGATRV